MIHKLKNTTVNGPEEGPAATPAQEAVAWRAGIAETTRSPELLRRLAEDPDVWVRGNVAFNEAVPEDVLRRLASAEEPWVRDRAAMNNSLPLTLAEQLARDEFSGVREAVAYVCTDWPEAVHILVELAKDPDVRVRYMVENSASTVLEYLPEGFSVEYPDEGLDG